MILAFLVPYALHRPRLPASPRNTTHRPSLPGRETKVEKMVHIDGLLWGHLVVALGSSIGLD